jgi:branched-chain amino acid transport system substrate-binding protein
MRAGFCLLLMGSLLLAACSPPEPIRLGFIGGLTGRVADLGEAGRNGFQLAVEQANAAGGIGGRKIEILVKDDTQNPAQAKRVAEELVAAKVAAIIGPMTSAMAEPVLAAATAGGVTVISPTVTTAALTGKDDLFLRVISDTSNYAGLSANYHFTKNGVRTIAVVFDARNRAYTAGWLADFRKIFTGLGGTIVAEISFESGETTDYAALLRQMLVTKPDALLFISSALDTARFAQQAAQLKATQKIIGVEWAATERLMELGGKAVDGLYLAQFFDRDDKLPDFQNFRQAYAKRFQQQPGFVSVAAYDATQATLQAIGKNKNGESLKQTLLERGPFVGAQQPIRFDRYGDAERRAYVTTIRDGRFVVIE